MPQDLLQSTQTEHIEDIGVPITACFMTQSSVDPTNWYIDRNNFYLLFVFLIIHWLLGGCLKNMTE